MTRVDLVSKSERNVAKILAQALDRDLDLPPRRPPMPYWGTAVFVLLAGAVIFVPTGQVVKRAMALENSRAWTPALLSGTRGRGPAWVARRPTEFRSNPGGTRAVTFRLLAPAAREVLLGGSFNNFNGSENPMVRGKQGIWEVTLPLSPGNHTYKFKVDGVWLLDPTNPEKTPAPRESSLVHVAS